MIVDSCEKAYIIGFLSYIKEIHTNYSQNCYELINIDEDADEKLLKNFKLNENEFQTDIGSMTIKDHNF